MIVYLQWSLLLSGRRTDRTMAAGDSLESQHAHHQQHLSVNGPPTSLHQDVDSGGALVNTSKSAFIELQHPYNTSAGIRSAYHPHHFSHQSLQPNTASVSHHHSVDTSGFVSSRTSLGSYPFSMHQNSQTGYLGSYAQQCPSPAKDGELYFSYFLKITPFRTSPSVIHFLTAIEVSFLLETRIRKEVFPCRSRVNYSYCIQESITPCVVQNNMGTCTYKSLEGNLLRQ